MPGRWIRRYAVAASRSRRLATVALVGAVVWYLAVYDWPSYAVDGWNWVQDISSVVPELPGM